MFMWFSQTHRLRLWKSKDLFSGHLTPVFMFFPLLPACLSQQRSSIQNQNENLYILQGINAVSSFALFVTVSVSKPYRKSMKWFDHQAPTKQLVEKSKS